MSEVLDARIDAAFDRYFESDTAIVADAYHAFRAGFEAAMSMSELAAVVSSGHEVVSKWLDTYIEWVTPEDVALLFAIEHLKASLATYDAVQEERG